MKAVGFNPLNDRFIVPVKVIPIGYSTLPAQIIVYVVIDADNGVTVDKQIDKQIQDYINFMYDVEITVDEFGYELIKDGVV